MRTSKSIRAICFIPYSRAWATSAAHPADASLLGVGHRPLLQENPLLSSPQHSPFSSSHIHPNPIMRACCCHAFRFLLTSAAPRPRPRPCVTEVAAEMVSTCTALCCCPLAVVNLLLLLLVVYPCTFLFNQARNAGARCKIEYAKRRSRSPSGEAQFNPLQESPPNNSPKQPVEISVGFVIRVEGGSRILAFDRTLRFCGLQVPASLRRRIGAWKEKKRFLGLGKWRCRSKRVHSSSRRRGVDEMESPGKSMGWSPSRGEGNESPAESEEGLEERERGFQHPFWKDCFEGGSVGFWRGLHLCESTRRCMQASSGGGN